VEDVKDGRRRKEGDGKDGKRMKLGDREDREIEGEWKV
jgi:hypothetical protein